MKNVRTFRKETLQSIADAVSKKGKYKIEVGGDVIASVKTETDAKYIRQNVRRFFKRVFKTAPTVKIVKAS